jgi:hypothetical protein
MERKWLYLFGLTGLLCCFGYFINDQFARLSKQVKISVGDKFPNFTYETSEGVFAKIDSSGSATLILFVRNGCSHCEHLEQTLDSILVTENGVRLRKKIQLVSLDEAPTARYSWATPLIYNAERNGLYFNVVPQAYLVNRQNEVLFKHIGEMPKMKLEQKISVLFE